MFCTTIPCGGAINTHLDTCCLLFPPLCLLPLPPTHSIDTPGVIQRVSELFKGNTKLILGFNTFLPPGYKIEIDEETQEPFASIPNQAATIPLTPQAALTPPAAPTQQATPTQTSAARLAVVEEKEQKKIPGTTTGAPAVTSAATAAASTGSGKQSIDFDQAISYVTKIKVRFQDQSDTYKAFLDILHIYQKEQTTIKRVYEQVSILFKDHPVWIVWVFFKLINTPQQDLLEEFAQFLPVPVNPPVQRKKGATKGKAAKKVCWHFFFFLPLGFALNYFQHSNKRHLDVKERLHDVLMSLLSDKQLATLVNKWLNKGMPQTAMKVNIFFVV